MQTTAQLSASALPAVQDQATLTKLFGLHSQWTHFDIKNADILNAIAHMADNHSASCHSPIHAIVNLLLPDIQLQTPSASALLHLSLTAVALTCVFRKVTAARQLHALVRAFQFCQVAVEIYEPGGADMLIVVDQGHQLKAMFVLLKLFRHHAIHSPANEACLGDAARASADVSLCKSLKKPSAHLMQNAVEDSCILAVAMAHTALSIIKHALKEIDFMSAPKNCTACVVLMTLLHHPMPQVPAQAAAVIVESGTTLTTSSCNAKARIVRTAFTFATCWLCKACPSYGTVPTWARCACVAHVLIEWNTAGMSLVAPTSEAWKAHETCTSQGIDLDAMSSK